MRLEKVYDLRHAPVSIGTQRWVVNRPIGTVGVEGIIIPFRNRQMMSDLHPNTMTFKVSIPRRTIFPRIRIDAYAHPNQKCEQYDELILLLLRG